MLEFNFTTAEYAVSGLSGFSLKDAMRFWKAKFETVKHFKRDVIKHNALVELGSFVEEMWDDILPITTEEALREQNMERRRAMFDCIGVSNLFKALKPQLLDKQIINKVRTRWDERNHPYEHRFDDTYELYKIEGHKLFKQVNEWRTPDPVYAVRCWCTTTNREYWIYVPEDAAFGEDPFADRVPDVIKGIAWTIRINITHPQRIYRQGDIILVQESEQSKEVEPYHLSKKQYLSLMYSET